ncbi:SAM-dependent methyltransferase [Streptomyces beigongshangae]|uniref:SAM-dependent methyltransferase n=1 Tax=Streptomyces beigongshangae TaxID=2841597 RepID=UPI001C864C7F|nr:SAM-dependent methyltransferase [Streptomyces sp. REN17]
MSERQREETGGPVQEAVGNAQLVVVGTGFRAIGDFTLEARACIEQADKVLCLIGDPLVTHCLGEMNSSVETLDVHYAVGKKRHDSYEEMVQRILSEVRRGQFVCVALYGHPGVFAHAGHEAIRRARLEGISARMLPAPSAEDWLFADLGLDPGKSGCQSFEASDFLIRHRVFDPTSLLILWQVGVIGMMDYDARFDARPGAACLTEVLLAHYGTDHPVTVYEASPYVTAQPRITTVPLAKLPDSSLRATSTLVVPPLPQRPFDRDLLARLTRRR